MKTQQKLALMCFATVMAIGLMRAAGQTSEPSAASHWTSNGPHAGITSIAVAPTNPSIVYAGSTSTTGGDGIFKSINAGKTWTAVNNGVTNKRINAIAVDPHNAQIVYAGYEGEGFYKTVNGGETWATVNETPLHHGTYIAIDSANTSVLYLGTDSSLYKSIDGGKTCRKLTNGLPEAGSVTAIIIDPKDHKTVYIAKYNGSVSNCGVSKSTDGGETWVRMDTGVSDGHPVNGITSALSDRSRMTFSLAIDLRNSKIVYVGTLGGGVFKTMNGGASWTRFSDGIDTGMSWGNNIYSLAIDPRNSRILYAGTAGGGVFRTTDGGTQWTCINDGLPAQSEHGNMTGIIWGLALSPHKRILYAGYYGTDNGVQMLSIPSK